MAAASDTTAPEVAAAASAEAPSWDGQAQDELMHNDCWFGEAWEALLSCCPLAWRAGVARTRVCNLRKVVSAAVTVTG